MKNLYTFLICTFFSVHVFGQSDRKVSFYLNLQGNYVIYDRVQENSKGAGAEFEIVINTKSQFKPILDFNWEVDKFFTFEQLESQSPRKISKTILIIYTRAVQSCR